MYRVAAVVFAVGLASVGGAVALVMAQNGTFSRAPTPQLSRTPDIGAVPPALQGDTQVGRMSRPVVGPQGATHAAVPVIQAPAIAEVPVLSTQPKVVARAAPLATLADTVQTESHAPRHEPALRHEPELSRDAPLAEDTWQIGVFR